MSLDIPENGNLSDYKYYLKISLIKFKINFLYTNICAKTFYFFEKEKSLNVLYTFWGKGGGGCILNPLIRFTLKHLKIA